MKDFTQLWEGVMIEVQGATSKNNFSTWFGGTRIVKIEDGVVQLGVPSPFAHDWLSGKFHNEILRALRKLNDHVRGLEYTIVKEELKKKPEDMKIDQTPTISMPLENYYINKEDNLNPRYVFENFIVGPYNELAHSAALTITKNPGHSYNPLFIYGGTGHGKTHLIQAVGNNIKKAFPNKKVFYLTSERFGSEYMTSLQENKAMNFKEKYRKYDVIVMDDVQFFSSKEKMQEELFHLFNTFYDTNRQLVFSSDRHPNFIPNLEDRLKTRFSAGMIIDLPAPDYESRMAILKAKLEMYSVTLPKETIEFISENIDGSVREIEGLVNTIVHQIQFKGKELSILEIKNLVKGSTKPKKTASVKEIVKIVSDFYNIKEESVFDKTRRKEVVKPRQVVMYILREDFNVSFPSIGEKMGGRDHTTAIHSYEKIRDDLKTNPVLMEEISQIRAML